MRRRPVAERVQRKNYPTVEARGDEGSNREVLAVMAVIDPSEYYPDVGRVIMGSAKAGESVPFCVSFTPENARKLGEVLIQAAADSDAAKGDLSG